MTQKQKRQLIYDKFGGKCYLCGTELNGKFHVDEFEPVRRNFTLKGKMDGTCMHPERYNTDNQMPACASCNINKHSYSLEEFRRLIGGYMTHLNERNVQYAVAKRYGLVQETGISVDFYFEKIDKPENV